jgi:hypothetical protein
MASVPGTSDEPSAGLSAQWPRTLGAMAFLFSAMLVLFHEDVANLVFVWWKSSTFNHCLLLPAILVWLVVLRWEGLRQLEPQPWRLPLIWLVDRRAKRTPLAG